MEECYVQVFGALSRSFVYQAHSFAVTFGKRVAHAVLYAESHMVHAVVALVKPFLPAKNPLIVDQDVPRMQNTLASTPARAQLPSPETEQLRVTLTGPTMSGKSTLLGTLTTSTLDNGRGKSRLSMLKHRHEITSGITSSVTQELLGYRDGVGAGHRAGGHRAAPHDCW